MRHLMMIGIFVAFSALTQARSRKRHPDPSLAEMLLVSTPKDGEVCFAPAEPCDVKLAKFMESATQSIDVAIYDLNLDHIVHLLLVASRKIPVRILVDKNQARGRHSLVSTLVRAGANVRFGRQRGIMHNKFTVVDKRRLETGSFNYTNHASEANNENQIYLDNPGVVRRYAERFETIWNEGVPATVSPADR